MKKIKTKILDWYFDIPIIVDFFVGILVYLIGTKIKIFEFKYLVASDALNFVSNLVGTNISLAGFLLASLTIIVTFKSNLKSKKIEDSNTALELIFNTDNYNRIVMFFKKAIIELIIIAALLYTLWLCINNIEISRACVMIFVLTIITILTIWRCLFVLFKVLHSDTAKRE